MKKQMLILPIFLVAVVALILGAAASEGWAQPDPPECFFNIEFNATDLDVGVRGFFDYEPWDYLEITADPDPIPPDPTDPPPFPIAYVEADNSLEDQGFAEWFFESGEPELDGSTYTFTIFFERFPKGDYEFEATPIEDGSVFCEAELTHVIPCAPEISAAGNRGIGVTISWDEVTQVVDAAATDTAIATNGDDVEAVCEDPGDLLPPQVLDIVGYEVIVENEDEEIFKIDLLEDARSVMVPPAFIEEGEEYQYEVLAIDVDGNQTITEECFAVSELNGHVVECPEDNGD